MIRFRKDYKPCIIIRWPLRYADSLTAARYEKILLRICGKAQAPNQFRAVRILQWISVGRRPLRKLELVSGIILDNQVSRITTATRPKGDVLSLCYPILETCGIADEFVNFIHFTAHELVTILNLRAENFMVFFSDSLV